MLLSAGSTSASCGSSSQERQWSSSAGRSAKCVPNTSRARAKESSTDPGVNGPLSGMWVSITHRPSSRVRLNASRPSQKYAPDQTHTSQPCVCSPNAPYVRRCTDTCCPRSRKPLAETSGGTPRPAWNRRTASADATRARSGSRPIGRPGSSRRSASTRGHGKLEVADPGFEAPRRIGDPGAVVVVEPGGMREQVGSVLRPEAEALEVRVVQPAPAPGQGRWPRFTARSIPPVGLLSSIPLCLASGCPRRLYRHRKPRRLTREAHAFAPPPVGLPGETHPPRANSLVFVCFFPRPGRAREPRVRPGRPVHHRPHSHPGSHAARLPRRARRARPRPHRLRQDLCLPAAAGGPAPGWSTRWPAAYPSGLAARPDPGPDARARRPDRRRPQAAGSGGRAAHPDHLRRCRPGPAGQRPEGRRRHRGRLPRPARGPHRPGPLQARRRRGHRPRRGRPHGRPRLPARRTPPAVPHARRRPADAVLGHPRQGDRRARPPVPEPAEDPPGRLGPGDRSRR